MLVDMRTTVSQGLKFLGEGEWKRKNISLNIVSRA
jgi:hypothetical protein